VKLSLRLYRILLPKPDQLEAGIGAEEERMLGSGRFQKWTIPKMIDTTGKIIGSASEDTPSDPAPLSVESDARALLFFRRRKTKEKQNSTAANAARRGNCPKNKRKTKVFWH
jgi:hypothetical protein